MRHATWNAVWTLSGDGPGAGVAALACWAYWHPVDEHFDNTAATSLLRGSPERQLPDCPTCANFIDAALTIRAEAEQEKINAELDAERGTP